MSSRKRQATFRSQRYPATLPEIIAAQKAGAAAVNDNLPPWDCPHRATDERSVFLAAMWHRGYKHRQAVIREANAGWLPLGN